MVEKFDYYTQNLNMAAIFGALRFPVRIQVYHDVRSGKVQTHFELGAVSVDGQYQRDLLLAGLEEDKLERENNMHPLLIGARAIHNYEALLSAQKLGTRLRLAGCAGSQCARYVEGQEVPELVNAKAVYQTADLSLVAALGVLGLPVIEIANDGGGRKRYTLPVLGHVLLFRGAHHRHSTEILAARMAPGSYDLRLETDDPTHPMVAAYNACCVRGQLKKELNNTGKILIHRHAKKINRMAMTTEHPAAHVKEKLGKHMS